MNLVVKCKNKNLFITYISMDTKWALVTYDKKKLFGVFKVDMADLTFNKKQIDYISKINLKF